MSDKWHYTERLTNEEFILLLPYLSLENQYLTQVKRSKWKRLIDANFQTFVFMCGVCNKPVKFEFVNQHFKSKQHLKNLRSNVYQLYHPFYTYGKGDAVLSKGEKTSTEHKKAALKEVNSQIKSFSREASKAKQFVVIVHRRETKCIEDFLTNLSLERKAEKPDEMFVSVCIPFCDLPDLMFCGKELNWKQTVIWKDFNRKSNFTCNICNVKCSGIDSLNSHFKGFSHKCEQLQIMALSYEKSSKVTKYCTIFVGSELMISVHEKAKSYYANELEAWQKRNGDDSDGNGESSYIIPDLPIDISTKARVLEELTQKALKQFETEKRVNESKVFWGHIGVEYVLKFSKNSQDDQPSYECSLCEIRGNDERMQRHLLCFDHKKKYLDLHYVDTMRKYENAIGHLRYAEYRAVMGEIVTRVAIEIEKHHGRSLPYSASLNDYKNYRTALISQVYNLLHASQIHGPSFSNVVSVNEIEKLKTNCNDINRTTWDISKGIIFTTVPNEKVYLHQSSHDPIIRLREYNTKLSKKQEKSRTPVDRGHHRSSSRNREGNVMKSHSRSPRKRSLESNAQNIWDVYRRELAIAATQIEHTYDGYRVNPESHPLYEQEWNEFWQNRKLELERDGINHRTYNFQPEWVHFFKQRIEQLFGDALQKAKIAVRCKLNIPLDAEEDCNRHENELPCNDNRQRNFSRQNNLSPRTHSSNHPSEEFNRSRANTTKRAGDNYDNPPKRHYDEPAGYSENRITDSKLVDTNIQNWGQGTTSASLASSTVDKIPKIVDNHSNIVHVLRLMTALEDYLGSLGPKIMDMLATALQLEKTFLGNVVEFESKILSSTNCNILETAMEKLKGILFAGLLDDKKLMAFNRVIQFTTDLLKYAEKMGWRQNVYISDEQQSHMSSGRCHSMASSREKSLTDTLMDFMSDKSNDRFDGNVVCPPPPVIGMTHKPDILNSGTNLANFNTQLGPTRSSKSQLSQQQQQQQQQQQHCRQNVQMMSRNRTTCGPSSGSGSVMGGGIGGNSLNSNNFNSNINADLQANLLPNANVGSSRHPIYNNPSSGSGNLPLNNTNSRQIMQNCDGGNLYQGRGISRSGQSMWGSWNKN